jgi:hypothetical protein
MCLQGKKLTERQAADICLQLLRVLARLHSLDLSHGMVSQHSVTLTTPPKPRTRARANAPPTRGTPLLPVNDAAAASLGLALEPTPAAADSSATLTTPRSYVSNSSEVSSPMTSWLLPGFPRAVHSHDGPSRVQGDPVPDLIRFTPAATPRGPHSNPPLSAAAEQACLSCSRSPSEAPEPRRRRRRRDTEAETHSVSVNEVFEGFDDCETSASLACSGELPLNTAAEVQLNSVSHLLHKTLTKQKCSLSTAEEGEERRGSTNGAAAAPCMGNPTSQGTVDGGTEAEEWVGQGDSVHAGHLLMEHKVPGTGSSGASSRVKGVHFGEGGLETGCIGVTGGSQDADVFDCAEAAVPRGSGELTPQASPTPHGLMDTRWSFENGLSPFVAPRSPEIKLAGPRIEEESVTALFEKVVGPPLQKPKARGPVMVHVRAGAGPADVAGSNRRTTRVHKRQLKQFQAAMHKNDEMVQPLVSCPRCSAGPSSPCPDCLLLQRSAGKKALRSGMTSVLPAANPSGGTRQPCESNRRGRRRGRRRCNQQDITASTGLHVQLHMTRLQELPPVGVARRAAMQADAVAAGLVLLQAIIGTAPPLAALQRLIKHRQPLSREGAWLVLSNEARDLIECLLIEQLSPETALEVRPSSFAPVPCRKVLRMRVPVVFARVFGCLCHRT